MKKLFSGPAVFLLLLAIHSPTCPAQTGVPGIITYQGRVTVAGQPYTGTGLFKFALVSGGTNSSQQAYASVDHPGGALGTAMVFVGGAGYTTPPAVSFNAPLGGSGGTATATVAGGVVTGITINNPGSGYIGLVNVIIAPPPVSLGGFVTYWTHEANYTQNGEPPSAVTLPVVNGLFLVGLGDTNQANMNVLPASVVANDNVHLRIWFNDGTNGFAQLTPDQPLTAAPYALLAQSAVQLTGPVASAQLSGTYGSAVTLNNSGNNFSGSFTGNLSGNGSSVTNLNLAGNSGGAIALSGNFVLSSSPTVGNSPCSVTSADVNGDGKPDLICANQSANTLSVLINNGSGSFVLASSPSVGSFPSSVTSADVNGDGKSDLIIANAAGNTLTVLTNNGSGGFTLSSSPGVGSAPKSVTSADVNGDGKPDLISANQGPNTLSVLTNNGTGGFTLSSSPGVGSAPISVTAADVNGDGKPDLISANESLIGTLTVLTNNGSGGFVLASSPSVGSQPSSVTSADVNGDGRLDLISANQSDNTLSVLTNAGAGRFVLASSPSVGVRPRSVTAADVNGDGKPDLIVANYVGDFSPGTLTVLTNNGSGGFALAALLNVDDSPTSVMSADMNGDGKPDLISAHKYDNSLTVFLNMTTFFGNGSGLLIPPSAIIGGVTTNIISSDPHSLHFVNGILVKVQ